MFVLMILFCNTIDLFMKVKKYDTPVWKSRVPLLTDYLADATSAVGEQLSQVGHRIVTMLICDAGQESGLIGCFYYPGLRQTSLPDYTFSPYKSLSRDLHIRFHLPWLESTFLRKRARQESQVNLS